MLRERRRDDESVSPPRRDGRLLSSASSPRHVVQFYERYELFVDVVAEFLAGGLLVDEPVLILARTRHRALLLEQLAASGFDVEGAQRARQLICLDTDVVLSSLLVNGLPDAGRFRYFIESALGAAPHTGLRAHAYGEMVDLLVERGQVEAAVRLEELWDALVQNSHVSVCCAYRISGFGAAEQTRAFENVCHLHSHVLPAETYARDASPDARMRQVVALQQRASALEAEIEQRRGVEAELREALRARDDFLSAAGHELRTPLTSLALRVQLLQREAQAEANSPFVDRVRVCADSLNRQFARLSHLVSDLLDVGRLAAGRLAVESAEIDFCEVLREVAQRFEAPAARGDCALLVDAPPTLLGRSDRLRVEQIVTNLLDNAIKYGRGKPVRLSLSLDEGRAALTIADKGTGIPSEYLDRIFERFERAPSEPNEAGLGLGLYITRELVQALGGAISVDSQQGHGATFRVQLPLA